MNMKKKLISGSLILLFGLFIFGCDTNLEVQNIDTPDTERVLASSGDVESLIASSYLAYWQGIQSWAPGMALSVTADQLTGSWGNFAMQDLSSEPRAAWDNSSSYRYSYHTEFPWFGLYNAISNANDGLKAMARDDIQVEEEARAKAFAKFVQGLSHGFIALFFDQGFVFDETVDLNNDVLELKPYNEIMDAAIGMLEEAIAIANTNSFEIPDTWVNGLTLTNEDLAKLAHSYIARYMTQVARDENERANVNWAAVINHVNAGITEDFAPVGNGDFDAWWKITHYFGQNHIWVRADYKTIGWTDQSGNFDAWLGDDSDAAVANRDQIEIDPLDRRVTGAAGDPTSEGKDFRYKGSALHRPDRGLYHRSFYQHKRWEGHLLSGATGPMVEMTVTEMNLIKAEALYYTGDLSGAADLVNLTRTTRGEMDPLTGNEPDFYFWLKYEKRIEAFLVGVGTGFFDARGWGMLVRNTPIHFPIPGSEIETIGGQYNISNYTFGGGGPGSAPKLANRFKTLRDALRSEVTGGPR